MGNKDYYGLGYNFLQLVSESISEMIKEGNRTTIFSDSIKGNSLSLDEVFEQYDSQTRWNDFNIGVPLLFNLYHGIELIMKGILQGMGEEIEETHNIHILYERISTDTKIPKELLELFKKYLFKNNPFHDVFTSNGVQTNKYYLLFRYPDSQNNKEHRFGEVRGKEGEGLEKFKTLKRDILLIKKGISDYQSLLRDNS